MLMIALDSQASEFLKKLQPKQYKQVANAVFELAADPRPHDSGKLKGFENLYRKTCGEYRIVYRFTETTLYVDVIDNRNDDSVYRTLERKF